MGGIAVLKRFVEKYGDKHEYVYFGDSARAPYGNKTKEELKSYVIEIADHMQERDVDVLISACNTSSMYLHEVDFEDYFFQVISLYDVMKDYFAKNKFRNQKLALLATSTTIDSRRYLDWKVDIVPIKCPKLVPLIEAGDFDQAYDEWLEYLNLIPVDVTKIILGCTHYSLLVDQIKDTGDYEFIDPAQIVLEYFDKMFMTDALIVTQPRKESNLIACDFFFSKDDEQYSDFAKKFVFGG